MRPFIPPSAQAAYLCVRAFNVTLAAVADNVSTPAVGALRMQYWRDAIARTFDGRPPKEPVAVLLSHVLGGVSSGQSPGLSRAWFTRVIDARARRLHNPPFPDLAALEAYAEHTYSTLLYLTLSGVPLASVTADHLASHVMAALRAEGVPTAAYYPKPIHMQSAYRSYPLGGNGLPVTEAKAGVVVSLPMHPDLDDATQDRIVDAVHRAVAA